MTFSDQGLHEKFEELAAGWALHALEPQEAAEFAEHLATCAHCQRIVDDLTATAAELAYAAPSMDPPPELKARIMSAAAELPLAEPLPAEEVVRTDTAPVADLAARREARRTRGGDGRGRWAWIVTAAAIVLAVALGGWNVVLLQQNRSAQQAAEQRETTIRQLVQPGARIAQLSDPSGKPMAYVLTRGGRMQIVTDGMAANKAGDTSYWVWGVSGAKADQVTPMARFDVSDPGVSLHDLGPKPDVALSMVAFAVSVEPGQAKPTKPTRIIAKGAVD